jgi:hypothetical protein
VQAYVNITEDTANARPMGMYLNDSPVSIPRVSPGLTLAEGTRINGSLAYTSAIDLPLPADAVSGQVTRIEPVSEVNGVRVEQTPTPAQRVGDWAVASLRNLLTLLLFGLLMGWLFPRFMRLLPANLRAEPITSLGWGAILFAAAFFGAFVIVLVALFLTVAGLGWNIIGLAWLLLTILGATFFLATSYLSKVIVGETIGRWILSRRSPALAEHKIWPMVVGLVAVVLVIALLRFPLLPLGFFGWMLNFLVILFGLGALWTWGRQLWLARHTSPQQP